MCVGGRVGRGGNRGGRGVRMMGTSLGRVLLVCFSWRGIELLFCDCVMVELRCR